MKYRASPKSLPLSLLSLLKMQEAKMNLTASLSQQSSGEVTANASIALLPETGSLSIIQQTKTAEMALELEKKILFYETGTPVPIPS